MQTNILSNALAEPHYLIYACKQPNAKDETAKKMGEIKIEHGIPIPAKRTGRSSIFDEMEVGDSILCPHAKSNSIRAMASMAGARLGRKFTARKIADGVRVWRIK